MIEVRWLKSAMIQTKQQLEKEKELLSNIGKKYVLVIMTGEAS